MKTGTLFSGAFWVLVLASTFATFVQILPFLPENSHEAQSKLWIAFLIGAFHFVLWGIVFWTNDLVSLMGESFGDKSGTNMKVPYLVVRIIVLIVGVMISLGVRMIPNLPERFSGISMATILIPIELWLVFVCVVTLLTGYLTQRPRPLTEKTDSC